MKEIESLFNKTVKDLQDKKLIEAAQEHVGGNTEFLSSAFFKEGDAFRGDEGIDNAFFSKYGTGNQLTAGAAKSPFQQLRRFETMMDRYLNKKGIEPESGFWRSLKEGIGKLLGGDDENYDDEDEDVVVLPPIGGEDGGQGDTGITVSTNPPVVGDDEIEDTESFIPFIAVISNHNLSIVT